MQKHERFEELCSLAIIGELSPQEYAELAEHMSECPACRRSAREFADTMNHLPAERSSFAEKETLELQEASCAEHFFSRAQTEGITFSKDAIDAEKPRRTWFPALRSAFNPAFALAAIVLVAAGAIWFVSQRHRPIVAEQKPVILPSPIQSATPPATTDTLELARAKEKLASIQQELDRAVTHVASARTVQERTSAELSQQTDRANELQERLAQAQALLSQSQSESQQAKAERDKTIASLVDDETRLRELEAELKNGQSTIDQERQLNAAAHDVRELMGARNLHIVDVYDSDNRSADSRSFGRVIYVEGKSLIFYAFDLDKVHNVRKVVFQAWGEREGLRKDPMKLGVFYVDDVAQKRWVMKLTDTAKLRAIDTVFVTVESHADAHAPSGQRLLQAFLGSKPNHP